MQFVTNITIDEPLQLYNIGPDYSKLRDLDLGSEEMIPRTVVVDPHLANKWLEKVSTQKYPSIPRKLDNYTIDYQGLLPIDNKFVHIKIYETTAAVSLIYIEDVCSDLVDIYESRTMGPLRALRLRYHNLLLLPDTGSSVINQLQPYLEEGKKMREEFTNKLRSINHPNVKISGL